MITVGVPHSQPRSGMPSKEEGGPLNKLLSGGDTITRKFIPSHPNDIALICCSCLVFYAFVSILPAVKALSHQGRTGSVKNAG